MVPPSSPEPPPDPSPDSPSDAPKEDPRGRWVERLGRWIGGAIGQTQSLGRSAQQGLQNWREGFGATLNLDGLNLDAINLDPRQLGKALADSFRVRDDQVAEILAAVRAELPTTEALLLGKTQAGKSSIARGLTGGSAAMVGQGFRPHTQHTSRYAYPSEALPLLVFTDTVGLGDLERDRGDRDALIEELGATFVSEDGQRRAGIAIVTVKITDFATDSLRQVVEGFRQRFPQVPILLAITCLHEVYPRDRADHPPEHPPDLESVSRPAEAIAANFAGLCDRTVWIDFTLEEDDYHPVFYGLEALRDAIAALLPEAEARTLHQLLEGETGDRLGDLYRTAARRQILAFAIAAATLAAVPLPFATMPVLTAVQVSLVVALGKLYGQSLSVSQAGGVLSAIAGGFVAQTLGRELIKIIPGFGTAIAATWAAAYTWALGEGACAYFGDLLGGKKPDPQRIQTVMAEAFAEAQERFKHRDQKPSKY